MTSRQWNNESIWNTYIRICNWNCQFHCRNPDCHLLPAGMPGMNVWISTECKAKSHQPSCSGQVIVFPTRKLTDIGWEEKQQEAKCENRFSPVFFSLALFLGFDLSFRGRGLLFCSSARKNDWKSDDDLQWKSIEQQVWPKQMGGKKVWKYFHSLLWTHRDGSLQVFQL